MRILMMNKFLYPRAGAETYMIGIAEALIAAGHEVGFFGMAHPENTTLGESWTIPFLEFGNRQGQGALAGNLLRAGKQALMGETATAFRACVAAFKPDLIHAHNVYNQLSPSLPALAPGVPALMTAHDYKAVCPNYSLFTEGERCVRCLETGSFRPCISHRCAHGSLLKSVIAAADSARHRRRQTYQTVYQHIVAPSQFMKDRLVQGGLDGSRITVVNNYAVLPDAVSHAGKTLLYAGRLCTEKGVDTLLQAYADLQEPRPDLRILGEGPLGDELRGLARAKGLDRVEWLGRVPPSQVAEEMLACGAVIVPSRWHENCSMVIMETLAAGRAVITSDTGGNPELVEHGVDGYVFPAEDAAALQAILRRVADEPDDLRRMGLAARATAEKRFDRRVHMADLMPIYEQLVAAGGGGRT